MVQNCIDIANDSKALQDSLEKVIDLVKAGKIKANLGKLEAACAANVAFMNKLAPALADCQGLPAPALSDEARCKGPCANPWELLPPTITKACYEPIAEVMGVKTNVSTPINCVINATVSLVIDYVAGWGMACIEDEKLLNVFDFGKVKTQLNYGSMAVDALGECAISFVPFIAKSKVADAIGSAIIGAGSGFAGSIDDQYEANSKKYTELSDVIANIDVSLALQKAGVNAVTNVVANVLGNKLSAVIQKKVAAKGPGFVKNLLVKAGLSDEVSENILKKLGYKLARPLSQLAPNGKIPKNTDFDKWFDELSLEELIGCLTILMCFPKVLPSLDEYI